jgi:hypothetical protein
MNTHQPKRFIGLNVTDAVLRGSRTVERFDLDAERVRLLIRSEKVIPTFSKDDEGVLELLNRRYGFAFYPVSAPPEVILDPDDSIIVITPHSPGNSTPGHGLPPPVTTFTFSLWKRTR